MDAQVPCVSTLHYPYNPSSVGESQVRGNDADTWLEDRPPVRPMVFLQESRQRDLEASFCHEASCSVEHSSVLLMSVYCIRYARPLESKQLVVGSVEERLAPGLRES